jgi:hypothetical protein
VVEWRSPARRYELLVLSAGELPSLQPWRGVTDDEVARLGSAIGVRERQDHGRCGSGSPGMEADVRAAATAQRVIRLMSRAGTEISKNDPTLRVPGLTNPHPTPGCFGREVTARWYGKNAVDRTAGQRRWHDAVVAR